MCLQITMLSKTVHHRYHIYRVSPQYGCGYVSSKLHIVLNCAPQVITLIRVFSPLWIRDMCLQSSTFCKLCTTGITLIGFSPQYGCGYVSSKAPLPVNCAPQVSHLQGFLPSMDMDHVSSNDQLL